MISKSHLDGVDDVGGEVGGAELLLGAVAELEEGLLAARRAETNECIPIFPEKRPNSDYFLKQ